MTKKENFIFFLLLILGGCSSVPSLSLREVETLPQLSQEQKEKSLKFSDDKWWKNYNDPLLNSLVKTILENNRSIDIALLNLEKSDQYINYVRGINGPNIELEGSYERSRLDFMDRDLAKGKKIIDLYDLKLSGNYTLDLFGKLDALEKEAALRAEGERLKIKFIQLEIATEIVNLYGYWIYLNGENKNLAERKKILEELEKIKKAKIQLGRGTEDELIRFNEELLSNKTLREINRSQMKITQNNLNILGGAKVDDEIGKILSQTDNADLLQGIQIPEGISSDLIIQRPDIKYYMILIDAQKEKLRGIKSDFYPKVILNGEIGYMSLSRTDFFKKLFLNGFLSPSIYLPILQGGRLKSSYKIAGVDLNIFIEEYNEAIFNAFKNVENNLLEVKSQKEIVKNSSDIIEDQKKLLSRDEKRYELESISKEEILERQYLWHKYLLEQEREHLNLFNRYLFLLNSLGGSYGK